MKKIILVLLTVMVVSFVTGCSSGSEISVTDEELSAISEYAAYRMLKYDRRANDQDKLILAEKLMEAEEAEGLNPSIEIEYTPVPTPVPTTPPKKKPTSTPTPKPTPKASSKNDDSASSGSQGDEGDEQGSIYVGEINGSKARSIGDCFGTDTFSFKYLGYGQQKTYRSSGQYYAISAPEGKELLVARIAITNTTDREARFVSDDYPVRYQLLMTDHKAVEPRLTLLPSDLQLLDCTIGAGKSQEALLLFYIDSTATEATLRILGDYSDGTAGKAYDIKLK